MEDATSPQAQPGEDHPVVFPLALPKRGLPKPNPKQLKEISIRDMKAML